MIRQHVDGIRSASMHTTTSPGSLEPALRTIETEEDAKRLWQTSPVLRKQFVSGTILRTTSWQFAVGWSEIGRKPGTVRENARLRTSLFSVMNFGGVVSPIEKDAF
jgi:hypothetical protein